MDVTVGVFVRGSKGRYQSFVDARVETFNFADLAPTVPSRRDRDKKSATDFTVIICFSMIQHLQTVFCELFVVWRIGDIVRGLLLYGYIGLLICLHIWSYSCYM